MKIIALSIKLFLVIFILVLGCQKFPEQKDFSEIIFIDHQNLRYVGDKESIDFQVESAKANIDKASKLGIDTYLFFAKTTFEAMLNYDFNVTGLGNIGEKAFPAKSDHRIIAEYMRDALNSVIDYAGEKQIRVFFHSNQFRFPLEVLEVIRPVVWGTAVCPGRKVTWEIYHKKLERFLTLFPDIAGFQVTGDETQVSVLECKCDSCAHLFFVDRVNILTRVTAQVCSEQGKEVQMRTWQRMAELEEETHPSHMGDGLPENVFFSIKNTLGDFHLIHPVDETFLRAAAPNRLVVEFDAWREFNGNNYFPCYMGDIWAPRFKLIKELGIKRIAVRLNWNSNKNPIFEMPWGNVVNIYTFLKLSENPERNADEILYDFIEENYPGSAQTAAFDLYKYSTLFQKTLYYLNDRYNANHSRIQDDDTENDLIEAQRNGFMINPKDFDIRRDEITAACEKAHSLVDKLGNEVPEDWTQSLKTGIEIEQMIALGTTDKMETIFWKKQGNTAKVKELLNKLSEHQKKWKTLHPESYQSMNGDDLLQDI